MLQIEDLTVQFHTHHGLLTVLDRVSLEVKPGEKLGVVGESGSGKTTLALTLLGMSGGEAKGSVKFKGEELLGRTQEEWQRLRGSSISMVRQQSGEMLTPTLPLLDQVMEPYLKEHPGHKDEARRRATDMLERVGLDRRFFRRYPYTISGGEVQRALLAMALVPDPELLILDEPVSSLDALTRADILKLLEDIIREREQKSGRECSVLVISHDLSSVARLADRTAVFYCGSVMETGPTGAVLRLQPKGKTPREPGEHGKAPGEAAYPEGQPGKKGLRPVQNSYSSTEGEARSTVSPGHPYTRALVRAYPTLDGVKELQGIRGEFPPLEERPAGCPFHPRCTQSLEVCAREKPVPVELEPGRYLSCHRGGVVQLLRGRGIRQVYSLDEAAGAEGSEGSKGTGTVRTEWNTDWTEWSAEAPESASPPLHGLHEQGESLNSRVEAGNRDEVQGKTGKTGDTGKPRGGILSGIRKKSQRPEATALEAVKGVDVTLYEGEVYVLVGESGSGKTTLGRILAGVDRPVEGDVLYGGKDIARLKSKESREVRRGLQLLFQNAGEALSHRLAVEELVAEPLVVQGIGDRESRREAVVKALEWVHLPTGEHFLQEYPHHLSGGELQRVALARALVLEPKVLVADEPSASLDASVQAKIVKLLLQLQNERGFALFLITHDLALAARAGDRVGVMHGGRIVEEGPAAVIMRHPSHPYTQTLLAVDS